MKRPTRISPFHVDLRRPHAGDTGWLAQADISTGYADGIFRPMVPVYRQDMAVFLNRLAGKPSYTPSPADKARFGDVDESRPTPPRSGDSPPQASPLATPTAPSAPWPRWCART